MLVHVLPVLGRMGKTETRNPQHFREMGRKMYYKHRKKILIHMPELRQQPEFKEYLERNKDKIAKAKYNRCVKTREEAFEKASH
jgi:hypothetical protein